MVINGNQTIALLNTGYGLDVRVHWQSSTGVLADLSGHSAREFVDYYVDDWGIEPSYVIMGFTDMSHPPGYDQHWVSPAAVPLEPVLCCMPGQIRAWQDYDWDCHDGNGWRHFMSHINIDRSLSGPAGARTFTTTKGGPGGPFVSTEAYAGPPTTTSMH